MTSMRLFWLRHALPWWLSRKRQDLLFTIARRLPRELKYWVIISVAGRTGGNPGDLTALDLLKLLGNKS